MKNKRILELAGIRHRSDLLLEEEGEDEAADEEGGDDEEGTEDLFGDTEDEGGED